MNDTSMHASPTLAQKRNPRRALGDMSPQERGGIKRKDVLRWIYVWHKTSTTVVTKILKTSQRDFLPKLEQQGLVQKVLAPSLPIGHVWMLTKDGLAAAIELTGELLDYDVRPSSIDFADLRHDLAVQLAALKIGVLRAMKPERLFGADEIGRKRPDAILAFTPFDDEEHGEYDCALEVEITHKKGRELDQALLAAAAMLERQEVGSVRYVSQSRALLENYKRTVAGPINVWERNEIAKKWVVTGQVRLEQWVIDSFEWCHETEIFKGLFFK